MPISIVCPGCKKRFSVSEKFAGQKGPCPSCKTVIQIPDKAEEVVIHAPEAAGPKDSKGTAVIKPIMRQETRFNLKFAVGIAMAVIAIFVAARVIGSSYTPSGKKGAPSAVPIYWTALAAVLLGPPLAFSGYSFLRNDEFEPYRGQELWIRVAACGLVYALLWGVFGYLPTWLDMKKGFEVFQLMYVAPPFIAAGAFAAYVSFELEMMLCVLHYGLYLIVTVLLRVTAGMNPF